MFEYKIIKIAADSLPMESKFSQTVLEGLSIKQKRLPSWLIFDAQGSEIFKEISELPEYLPAACEFEIINSHKKLITELVNGTIRMSKRLEFEIKNALNGNISSLDKYFVEIIKVGAYQILFNTAIPNYAAVNSMVDIVKIKHNNLAPLANALLRKISTQMKEKSSKDNSIEYLSNYYSHPEWLIKKWNKHLSDSELITLLKWNNKA